MKGMCIQHPHLPLPIALAFFDTIAICNNYHPTQQTNKHYIKRGNREAECKGKKRRAMAPARRGSEEVQASADKDGRVCYTMACTFFTYLAADMLLLSWI